MVGMSAAVLALLLRNRTKWRGLRALGALTVPVLTLHVLEEWILPGGFHYIYNIASAPALRGAYPMNQLTDMITNFGGGVLWFVLVLRNRYGKRMGFAVMVFSFFEAGVHVFLAFHSQRIFASWGILTPLYAPGLITALVFWLPLAVAHLVFFVRHGIRLREILSGILLLVVLSLLLVQLPEALLKRPDTPFGWTDQGFYDAYLKS
ncbi:MAG: HXXEE domain-containing protein [Lachnospiraceae bacterium]